MDTNLVHIDNFISDYPSFRNYCDGLDYEGIENPIDGIFYPGERLRRGNVICGTLDRYGYRPCDRKRIKYLAV